ncbi:protein of unknown function [Zhouia amylolytica]|uniref:DUF4856 domain-containing protein n=1 Tax=Zhouia amylolytica TaxID=376730 RepID=A0A1I6UZ19_9FLAO|nr:DUF4856 domain-containing protein [Zhouia amylolytica]SFT06690.1 protein of unknown function [Zhouia amylolytica]
MRSRLLLSVLSITTMAFTSCSSDDDGANLGYEIPASYTFERAGSSTVSYGGQTIRILMLDELRTYLKTQDNWPLDANRVSNMYSNTDAPFESADLNEATSKQLKSKTAASRDYFVNLNGGGSTAEQVAVRQQFENWLSAAAEASVNGANAVNAEPGFAGIADGSRLVDGNGLEIEQVMAKGLMGAVFVDQILNNYISGAVLDEASNVANNDNAVLEEGELYTTMEHKWDEAYGYIYGAGGGKYWDSYISQVDADSDFSGVRAAIDEAFIAGRAAIVNGDYEERDRQAAIIKENLSLVVAVRAVHYLQSGKESLVPDATAAFHALSEGYGFILSLRYTQNPSSEAPYLSKEDVDGMLETLLGGTNGFWDVDHLNDNLDVISQKIAEAFGFTVEAAAISE